MASSLHSRERSALQTGHNQQGAPLVAEAHHDLPTCGDEPAGVPVEATIVSMYWYMITNALSRVNGIFRECS